MKLKEAAEGMTITKAVYNIGFNGDDETQFDVRNFTELEELWQGFCGENGFAEDSVDYVEYAGPWETNTMKTSELIQELQNSLAEHGDMDAEVRLPEAGESFEIYSVVPDPPSPEERRQGIRGTVDIIIA